MDNDHIRLSQEMKKTLELMSNRMELISNGVDMLQAAQEGDIQIQMTVQMY